MTDTEVLHLALQAMIVAAKLATPILLVSLVIGFAVSVFQSVTQIQEASLSFVPKVVGVAITLLVAGHWMLGQVVQFSEQLFAQLPELLA
jgi:flagellar biosynthesis protein FliQ